MDMTDPGILGIILSADDSTGNTEADAKACPLAS